MIKKGIIICSIPLFIFLLYLVLKSCKECFLLKKQYNEIISLNEKIEIVNKKYDEFLILIDDKKLEYENKNKELELLEKNNNDLSNNEKKLDVEIANIEKNINAMNKKIEELG